MCKALDCRWLINLPLAMRSDGTYPHKCAFDHQTGAFPILTMERRNRMLRTIIASILLLMAVNQALAQMEPPEPYYDQQRKTWEYPLPPPPGSIRRSRSSAAKCAAPTIRCHAKISAPVFAIESTVGK